MRLVIFRWPVLFFTLLFSVSFTTPDYTGKNLLLLLGTNSSTKEFKVLKNLWLLDKNYESTQTGIKFFLNSTSGKVESILIAGENYYSGGNRFKKFTAALPYGISLNDNAATLQKKLGDGQKLMGRNALKFYKENTAVEVSYTDLETGKISSIKFYKEAKPAEQIIPLNINAPAELRQQPASKAVFEQKRTQFEQHIPVVPPVINNKKEELSNVKLSPFKKAVFDVFKSYRESNFFNIKNGSRSSGNFWNYHYTYNTNLKIPGEKFNMLYSFPFQNSPLDFVSVIKEADAIDASFVTTYKEFEKIFTTNFPASEGWKASCIKNSESKVMSDLEFSNDKYGSVVLDYSKSPKGRHILYIRFLLYSN